MKPSKAAKRPSYRFHLMLILDAAGVGFEHHGHDVTVFRTHACTGGGSRVHDLVTFRFSRDGRLLVATDRATGVVVRPS